MNKLILLIFIILLISACSHNKKLDLKEQKNDNTNTIIMAENKSKNQAQNLKISSIELVHTNPSMGPHENEVEISLTNNEKTSERINQFLDESIINNSITIAEYILAFRTKNKEVMQSVENNFKPEDNLNVGGTISNLIFNFSDGTIPLRINDVYRQYSVSHFYGSFTKYMVENGSKFESGEIEKNKEERPIRPLGTK